MHVGRRKVLQPGIEACSGKVQGAVIPGDMGRLASETNIKESI